ncbi:glycosyltransferase family 1 protein [Emticicia sp. BO119]|uniref:glycosyltransferase family 4 protein n=1 Tax=Emticicia sp. BO119 TaxID=2757768 RepID=UPI0015F0FF7A|nr:glycosyltransferase family 1 protein [Emticicia sp. BO119]MBA4849574.1 glycosyltransferase family 4 protein [Emticicia sp. BO119]
MRVLFDHQSFSGAKFGGVARYFYDLMHNLKYHQEVEVSLSLLFSNNEYLKSADVKKVFPFSYFLGYGLTNTFFSHVNRANSAFQITRHNYDLFHPTYFNDYFLNFLGKKPYVITHHDTIPEKFATQYAELDGFDKAYKQRVLDKAAKIIAVSENTKNDLLDIFHLAPEKIEVIHHSTHFATYKPADDFDIATPERYLLYVGNRENYKNFDVFLKAIAPILLRQSDLYLLCAGSYSFNDNEQKLFNELGISTKILHYEIQNDEVLFRVYQKAIAFVYPSLYEGFGIPILEAFACGCPVALSDRSCFPEVAQNAAIYFNPDNLESIAFGVERLIDSAELRLNLVKKGYQRLKDFSPENTAKKTLDVYRSVLNR